MKLVKKAIIAVLVLALWCGLVFVACSSEKVEVHNVFDQMYNEIIAAKEGKGCVFFSVFESGEIIMDLGRFEGVSFEGQNYKARIFYNYNSDIKELIIYVYKDGIVDDKGKTINYGYRYSIDERKVYLWSEAESFEPLLETFLPNYFKQYAKSGKENPYSESNLGDVTFELL